jgi:hypothetical protein
VAWQFEQIRAAMTAIWPWMRGELDRPVMVVAAKDENTMKLLAPQYWEKGAKIHPDSVFVTGPDRHFVALRADARAEDTNAVNPYYASYWSYAALLLDASFRSGPAAMVARWSRRGPEQHHRAENEIRFGMAPPWYVQTLSTQSRLRLPQLFATDRNADYYRLRRDA